MSKTKPPVDVNTLLAGYLSSGLAAYIRSSAKGYFDNPNSAESIDIICAATADALKQITANNPAGRATLRTFALALLDSEQPK